MSKTLAGWRGNEENFLAIRGRYFRKVSNLLFLALAVLALGQALASQAHGTSEKAIVPAAKDNFILYVSNQSFAVTPVDIAVHIDGKKVIQGEFEVESQHRWVRHSFYVEPGKHLLQVLSKKGQATFERKFEIRDRHWAAVEYWYYPKLTGGAGPTPRSFTFNIQDEPLAFQ